jgi:hypothetical protein
MTGCRVRSADVWLPSRLGFRVQMETLQASAILGKESQNRHGKCSRCCVRMLSTALSRAHQSRCSPRSFRLRVCGGPQGAGGALPAGDAADDDGENRGTQPARGKAGGARGRPAGGGKRPKRAAVEPLAEANIDDA